MADGRPSLTNNTAVDPRAICNLMLDEVRPPHGITNLALQKLLYFAHGLYLVETKRPLVSGYFEAWQFGPVHPAAYRAFKQAGDRAIEFRATKTNPLTGSVSSIEVPTDQSVVDCIRRVIMTYGRLTPGRLVDISHARSAPWHFIVDKARTNVSLGLRITDDVILDRFKFHKVSIGPEPRGGEPGEDAPFTT